MEKRDYPALLMLPGLGTDTQALAPLVRYFPSMKAPAWLPILSGESLVSYSQRLAQQWFVGPERVVPEDTPFFIGGVSWGGWVALEMALYLERVGRKPEGVILVSSSQVPSEVRKVFVWPQRWRAWLPRSIARKQILQWMRKRFLNDGTLEKSAAELIADSAVGLGEEYVLESIRMASVWERSDSSLLKPPFLVHSLHGAGDRTLTPPSVERGTLLLRAGHWITQTHTDQVLRWIEAILRDSALKIEHRKEVESN